MTAAKVTFFAVHSWMSFVRTHDQKDITIQHCKDEMIKKMQWICLHQAAYSEMAVTIKKEISGALTILQT